MALDWKESGWAAISVLSFVDQWVDLGLSGSVKSNAIVAQHDPASETN
jgi:hypothetical protein